MRSASWQNKLIDLTAKNAEFYAKDIIQVVPSGTTFLMMFYKNAPED